jgi:hypothetical protein
VGLAAAAAETGRRTPPVNLIVPAGTAEKVSDGDTFVKKRKTRTGR